jgi:hypothetical protein
MPNPNDTITAYGVVTGPAAPGQIICQTAVIPPGIYDVDCFFYTSGVAAALDSDNCQLETVGPPVVVVGVIMGNQGTPAISATSQRHRVTIVTPTALALAATVVGTGTAAYHCKISANLLGNYPV